MKDSHPVRTAGDTLQHTATHCNAIEHIHSQNSPSKTWLIHKRDMTMQEGCERQPSHKGPTGDTLQPTASHCITLQHTATHCNTLHYTASRCNTLQHTATHCNTLQHICPRDSQAKHSSLHLFFSIASMIFFKVEGWYGLDVSCSRVTRLIHM